MGVYHLKLIVEDMATYDLDEHSLGGKDEIEFWVEVYETPVFEDQSVRLNEKFEKVIPYRLDRNSLLFSKEQYKVELCAVDGKKCEWKEWKAYDIPKKGAEKDQWLQFENPAKGPMKISIAKDKAVRANLCPSAGGK